MEGKVRCHTGREKAVENFRFVVIGKGQLAVTRIVREFPFRFVAAQTGMGSFDCGCGSLSRSTTSAQVDTAGL